MYCYGFKTYKFKTVYLDMVFSRGHFNFFPDKVDILIFFQTWEVIQEDADGLIEFSVQVIIFYSVNHLRGCGSE